jgi:hypothetical protein
MRPRWKTLVMFTVHRGGRRGVLPTTPPWNVPAKAGCTSVAHSTASTTNTHVEPAILDVVVVRVLVIFWSRVRGVGVTQPRRSETSVYRTYRNYNRLTNSE